MMNNQGQTRLIALMLSVILFVLAIALIPTLTEVSTEQRTEMDCSNASINDYIKGSCLLVDVTPPYFFAILLGIAGLLLGARIVFAR